MLPIFCQTKSEIKSEMLRDVKRFIGGLRFLKQGPLYAVVFCVVLISFFRIWIKTNKTVKTHPDPEHTANCAYSIYSRINEDKKSRTVFIWGFRACRAEKTHHSIRLVLTEILANTDTMPKNTPYRNTPSCIAIFSIILIEEVNPHTAKLAKII